MKNHSRHNAYSLLRCLAALTLALILMLPCAPAQAEILPLMNLYLGDGTDGKTYRFSWSSYSGTDHYEYSIRDKTTNDLLRDHKVTSSTSGSLNSSYVIGGHSYHVWVGAYNSSDKLIAQAHGDFSAIIPDTCQHPDDDLVDRNMRRTYESRSNTTHAYEITCDLYCGICGELYLVDGSYVMGLESHDYNNGVCLDCKHRCTHNFERVNAAKYKFESLSSTQHKTTKTYNTECKCCEMPGDDDVVTTTNNHAFDSNGDCTLCDFRAGCLHTSTKLLEYSRSYRKYDDTEHEIHTLSQRVCANASCGVVRESGIVGKTYEAHNFSGNSCADCGYARAAALTVSVSRGQSAAETGATIEASVSISGGTGAYRIAWEVLFNNASVNTTDYSQGVNYSYIASKEGTWAFKVYVQDKGSGEVKTATTSGIAVTAGACAHTNKVEDELNKEYVKMSETKHYVYTYYQRKCNDCGVLIGDTMRRQNTANHSFDANGVCVCLFTQSQQPCDHSDAYEEHIDTKIEAGTAEKHIVIKIYKDACTCGAVLNAYREHATFVAHTYQNGICACGQREPSQDPCDHAVARTPQSSSVAQYNDSHHAVTTVYAVTCDCGRIYETKTETTYAAHKYNAYGVCPCGQQEQQTQPPAEEPPLTPDIEEPDTTETQMPSDGNPIIEASLYPLNDPVAGSSYIIRVVTNGNVARLFAINNDGVRLKESWSISNGNNGTLIWQRDYVPNQPSMGRYWQITAYDSLGTAIDSFTTNAVNILDPDAFQGTEATTADEMNRHTCSVYGDSHQYDYNGVCACGDFNIMEVHSYTLSLPFATYYYYEDHYHPVVNPGDSYLIEVFDTRFPDSIDRLSERGLHFETEGPCVVTGNVCAFNDIGEARIKLVRDQDDQVVATLFIGITALDVDDGWTYSDYGTNIVQLKDMEEVDWRRNSLYTIYSVAINDFETTEDSIFFEAYNSRMMIYAVVSYDKDGNEIEREYIEGYDATTSLIKDMGRTFKATGRIFDSKSGNNQLTQQTNVNLKIESGGCVKFLQPDEDNELFLVNIVEVILRTLDVIESTGDTLKVADIVDANKVIKRLGKDELVEITKELLIEELGSNALTDKEIMHSMLKSEDFIRELSADFTGIVAEKAKDLGIAIGEQVVEAIEDVSLLAMNGVSFGVTGGIKKGLDYTQAIVDGSELNKLYNDLSSCMNGERFIRLTTILVPDN